MPILVCPSLEGQHDEGTCLDAPTRRTHSLLAFKLGGVCRDCNSGWMSRLERRAKPPLIALSSGTRLVNDLSHPKQSLLSQWAQKAALVIHAASYSSLRIPQAAYSHLRFAASKQVRGLYTFALQTPDLDDDLLAVSAIARRQTSLFGISMHSLRAE
jgi:hypothetical protein